MTHIVFVFGTLKKGFPLHEAGLAGARFLRSCSTVAPYPMLVAGPYFAPMMFNEPGVGLRVRGESYEVGAGTLAELDRMESLGKPGNWRLPLQVSPVDGGPPVSAFAYMKSRWLGQPVHSGYLADYQDRRFIAFGQRR
ncbi:gamma-glutamylcyclotransferase family protein [Mesorhizobium retamae]|uniref:Gamma-glutamylcyclotransferase family protein n=1 Tax=Mesorhizobium retamae TaxID=2912854 RepID=A0ABS9QLN3_9HYPH|nr:gamma-glutamylcyclotransferase family protein [Mesorhizobium sp. IRAMC:0171]MCG7508245.1 gamma-glutamylcyclotransferase [Mesorhizobium sp. IRAMC:0171]